MPQVSNICFSVWLVTVSQRCKCANCRCVLNLLLDFFSCLNKTVKWGKSVKRLLNEDGGNVEKLC